MKFQWKYFQSYWKSSQYTLVCIIKDQQNRSHERAINWNYFNNKILKIHNREHFYSLCSDDSIDPIELVDSINPVNSIYLVDYIDPMIL